MKLTEHIENFEYYKKEFDTWEAEEMVIDKNKAFWQLKHPNDSFRKVCLYRDGCNMFVYGDYGQFTFDSMTWLGNVRNLEYDNIGYQMEKLNYDSRQTLNAFDEFQCEKDIIDWLKERLEDVYEMKAEEIENVINLFKEIHDIYTFDIDEFCSTNHLEDIKDIIEFTDECLSHTDEYEWIAFLRSTSFDDFDEECESSLWKAGKTIHQRYFICMYALQVCGEKLDKEGKTKCVTA